MRVCVCVRERERVRGCLDADARGDSVAVALLLLLRTYNRVPSSQRLTHPDRASLTHSLSPGHVHSNPESYTLRPCLPSDTHPPLPCRHLSTTHPALPPASDSRTPPVLWRCSPAWDDQSDFTRGCIPRCASALTLTHPSRAFISQPLTQPSSAPSQRLTHPARALGIQPRVG